MFKLFKKKSSEIDSFMLQQHLSQGPSTIGIDIGVASVNVAQSALYKGQVTLIKTRVVDIFPKEGELKEEATLRSLYIALEDFPRKNAKFVCVVKCPHTVARKVIVPYMPADELRGAVLLEAKHSIPFALEDAVADFNVVEEVIEKGIEKLSVIVAAAPRTTINKILSYFVVKKAKPFAGKITKKFDEAEDKIEPLGLKIGACLPRVMCLENIIERSKLRVDETLVTIEIGAEITEFNIFKNAKLQFCRKISFAGDEITKSLMGTLMTDKGKVELTKQEAEAIKKEYGIPRIENNQMIDGKITTNQVLSMVLPKIERLVSEIERSLDFYREQMHGKGVDRIVLFGGGGRLKGLPEFLTKELGIEAVVGDPIADINLLFPEVVEHDHDAHKLVLAIGASLSGLKGINLLPASKEKTDRKVSSLSGFPILKVGGVVCGVLILVFVALMVRIELLKAKKEKIINQFLTLEPQLEQVYHHKRMIKFLDDQPNLTEALKSLSHYVLPGLYLTEFLVEKDVVYFKGQVIGLDENPEASLSKFMTSLENGIFNNVKLSKTIKDRGGFQFSLQANFDK